MAITFVQRSLIIFAVLLCYYYAWVGAVNCEQEPYHPSCRGSQARKRLVPLPVMRAINCEEGDCRFPKIIPKFLIAIVEETPSEVHNPESNAIHSRKGRMRAEESKDVYLDDY
ncbi:uncharacterized protein LOC105833586 [Monomorium pharaonis]|uniref:uncharacterized protein LOC105833586 n=1 Tax=Monomorium pharaonis TaxID=307658 RepID=UPI00063F3A63|nr:uncharacterized protein LOC105833586 [Monomorium pharaonis]